MSRSRRQTALSLVPAPCLPDSRADSPTVEFCGYCAGRALSSERGTRVCVHCGLGVVLEADATIAPEPGGAFLVADRAMSICALSRGAEELLEVTEVQAIHRHLTELLTLADTEVQDHGSLAFAISSAVDGAGIERPFTLRPANLFGVRLTGRIGSCGPRPSALIVLER